MSSWSVQCLSFEFSCPREEQFNDVSGAWTLFVRVGVGPFESSDCFPDAVCRLSVSVGGGHLVPTFLPENPVGSHPCC